MNRHTKQLNSYEHIIKMAGPTLQTTAQDLINGRTMLMYPGGDKRFVTVNLKDAWGKSFKKTFFNDLVSTIGGDEATQARIHWNLKNKKPQHWGLAKFVISKHLEYIAEQDQALEMKQLRKELS